MQKILSNNLWKQVHACAKKVHQRKAAIAYVTRDLIGFRKGDVLVVNASCLAISCGETDAKLLRTLQKKGVSLYNCPDLHAKVLLLDNMGVVSSGNMSNSSANALVEAGLITDHNSTVAGIASFIEQLVQQGEQLTANRLGELCKINVVCHGGAPMGAKSQRKTKIRRLGNQTWLVGVRELVRDFAPEEQKMIEKAAHKLDLSYEKLDWIRWTGKSRFRQECREGDSVIQIWRSAGAKRPSIVCRTTPVLLKQATKAWTRFYFDSQSGRHAEMPWGKFKSLLKKLGYSKKLGPAMTHQLEPEMADAIARNWNSAFK